MFLFLTPKPKEHMVRKSVGFTPSLADNLYHVAKKYRIPFSELVRQCCVYALADLKDKE